MGRAIRRVPAQPAAWRGKNGKTGFALNIIRANQDKGSTRGKLERAAWDDAFLLELLAAG